MTLIELLVVIAIVATLTGILLVTLGAARGRARNVECLSNLRQLALGLRDYADAHRGLFPSGEEQPWYVQLGRHSEMPPSLLQCPEDPNASKISYQWRDQFVTAPPASLAGKKIDFVADSRLLLVFEDDIGWHEPDHINAATVNAAAGSYTVDQFEENLMRGVSSGELFFLEP